MPIANSFSSSEQMFVFIKARKCVFVCVSVYWIITLKIRNLEVSLQGSSFERVQDLMTNSNNFRIVKEK